MANYLSDRTGANIDSILDNAEIGGIGKEAVLTVNNLTDITRAGFYRIPNASLDPDNPESAAFQQSAIVTALGSGVLLIYLQNKGTGSGSRSWNVFNDSGIIQSEEILTTGNTTVDGSGFIKEASPIIRLYRDDLVANDQCNKGISLQHSSTGRYLIGNTPGFSKTGWYIETPKDANGNIKFFVEYNQLTNNDIEINTYEPSYSGGYASAGEPVDITEGRWIDIRLNAKEV